MKSIAIAIAAIALLVACSGDDDTKDTTTDPYSVYLQNAPKTEPTLSREDAQTRARLGCGQNWAPGTVDAILADAYKDLCP